MLCAAGFRKVSDLACDLGEWSGGRCEPAPCDTAPVVANSASLMACLGMPSGKACQPLCRAGYASTKASGILCSHGGWRYSEAARCRLTGCLAVPIVPMSYLPLTHCISVPPGQPCHFSCQDGYEPVGQLVCITGQWTKPTCAPRKCATTPHVSNVPLERCVGTASGATCRIFCGPGTVKTADLLCLQGDWQNEDLVRCRAQEEAPGMVCATSPTLSFGDGSACLGTPSGEECKAQTCVTGYSLNGPLQCLDGKWTLADCLPDPCEELPPIRFGRDPLVCKGLPKTAACVLQCEPGFTPGGAPERLAAEALELAGTRREALLCSEGARFSGPRCEGAPCASYPALPQTQDLSDCVGARSGTTCDAVCAEGFTAAAAEEGREVASAGLLHCALGRWQQRSTTRCKEASCGPPPRARWGLGAARCTLTASRGFCAIGCDAGSAVSPDAHAPSPPEAQSGDLVPGAPLLCLRGTWRLPPPAAGAVAGAGSGSGAGAGGAACQRFCLEDPPYINHAVGDLGHCVATPAGGFCMVACRPWHVPSGRLLCEPDGRKWNAVTCEPMSRDFDAQVNQSLTLKGIRAESPEERLGVTEALRRGLGEHLGLNPRMVEVSLTAKATSGPPPGVTVEGFALFTEPSLDGKFQLELAVKCAVFVCDDVLRRFRLAARRLDDLKESLIASVCERRCKLPWSPPSVGPDLDVCLERCPEAQRLELLYIDEPSVVERSPG